MKRPYYFFLVLLFVRFTALAAPDTVRVLFVGNSYVQVNNLPDIIAQIAANRGDVLIKTDVSIGGYTLQNHFANLTTRTSIAQKGWDFVVLQEQSQTPAFPDAQVASDCYPYARALDSLVHLANPCAKTLFYMTWGRKNGDAANCPSFPLICTYNGMDSLLRKRYEIIAQTNKSVLSPIGVAWHKMRDLYPATELYQADESHPSEAGSYLAACTFYSILFKKTPAGITYDYNLNASDAGHIRQVVKGQVWDSLSKWYQYRTAPAKPVAGFTQTVSGLSIQFNNSSQYGVRYQWIYGDGKSDTSTSPRHIYAATGSYSVRLIAINCDGVRDTVTRQLNLGTTGVGSNMAKSDLSIFPNPAKDVLYIQCLKLPAYITLYDVAGRACRSITHPQSNLQSLDLNQLPIGPYLLRVLFQDGTEVTQIIRAGN